MPRFYVEPSQISDNEIRISGSDVNHIRNVLRMKQGDKIIICNGHGKDYYCIMNRVSEHEILAGIESVQETGTELSTRITLYQGLPKQEKMEWIIQKAVELGVAEIVPVMTRRVIVKLDDKKKEGKKLERWQAIAENASKQSGRGMIPKVRPVMSFQEAVREAGKLELNLIPYENAKGMDYTREIMHGLKEYKTIGLFIGPEGGFEESEIEHAMVNKILPITLGRRILRTETAGLAALSMMVLMLDEG